jgi:hypothetical protein
MKPTQKELDKWDKILQDADLGMDRAIGFSVYRLEYGDYQMFGGAGWEGLKPFDYQKPLYHTKLHVGEHFKTIKRTWGGEIAKAQKKRWAGYSKEKRKTIGRNISMGRDSEMFRIKVKWAAMFRSVKQRLRKTQVFPAFEAPKFGTGQLWPVYSGGGGRVY